MTTKKKTAKKTAAAAATKRTARAKPAAAAARPVARRAAAPKTAKDKPRTRRQKAAVRRATVVRRKPVVRRTAAAAVKKGRRGPRQRPAAKAIPTYLLSGDFPEATPMAPPHAGAGAAPPGADATLPEAYGTRRLLLTAQDSRWLYACWDFTRQQIEEAERQAGTGRLNLRVHIEAVSEHPYLEIQLPSGTRHWFLHVDRPATRFLAELGYYDQWGLWHALALSSATLTPPEAPSQETAVRLATIPPEVPLPTVKAAVKAAVAESGTLAAALAQAGLALGAGARDWTPEKERAMAELVALDSQRRVWIGSLEITELVRRQLEGGLPPAGGGAAGERPASVLAPFGAEAAAPGSPLPKAERAKGEKEFWFNINAEVVVYGATEPDAEVTLGGRPIALRPDGTFTCRFALPDGHYELPAVAVSADHTDGRAAELKFSRRTTYRGDVGAQPQEPSLQPPPAESGD